MKKLFVLLLAVVLFGAAAMAFWSTQPIVADSDDPAADTLEFTIESGSSLADSTQQIANAGVPVQPALLALLARLTGKSARIKAGSYELKPGTTPLQLLNQLARGMFAQETIAIIEGWTFRQMRQAIAQHPALKHDTAALSDTELLAKITPDYRYPEGLFFPDTYLFAKGASDLQLYRQAYAAMMRRLKDAWAHREASLPYDNPYEALTMASIIEKETGQKAERDMIAAVFVNRLRRDMLLQTDPTVIYGMGERYKGNITKRDLLTDTPYNTYTRRGLPPTPIALPSAASLAAAFNPAATDALYFVSRGDGSSHFSSNLNDHNKAVNRYQR